MTSGDQPRELALNQLWETLATAAKAAFFFIATPVLIARLGSADYGLFALSLAAISCVVALDFGLRPNLRVALSSLQDDAPARRRLHAEVLGAFLAVQAFACAFAFIGARAQWWSRVFRLPDGSDFMLVAALAGSAAYALSLLLVEPLASRRRLSLVKAAAFCGHALAVPIVIVLAHNDASPGACFLGYAASLSAPNFLLALVCEPHALGALLRAPAHFHPQTLGRTLFAGRWFALYTSQWLARSYVLTFLISALFGPTEAGVFFILLKLSEFLSVFGANTSETAIAELASQSGTAPRRARFLAAYRTTLAASVVAFAGLAALTPWVLQHWFHVEGQAASIGVLVGLFGLAGGFDRTLASAAMGLGLVHNVALWSFAETAVALGGAVALSSPLGLDGVLIAGACGALAMIPTACRIARTLDETARSLWLRPALPFFAGVMLAVVFALVPHIAGIVAALLAGTFAGWRCLRS